MIFDTTMVMKSVMYQHVIFVRKVVQNYFVVMKKSMIYVVLHEVMIVMIARRVVWKKA